MIEIITQQAKEWFEERGIYLTEQRSKSYYPRIRWRTYYKILDGQKIICPHVIIYVTHLRDECVINSRKGTTSYELANPEFPDNMFHDIEEIIQDADPNYT